MLPALSRNINWQYIYCHYRSPGLQPHLSTRWTRQTRLTNSQGAIHESWMARCSPRAPGFSREQYAWFFCFLMWTVLCFWLINKFQWDASIHGKIRCMFMVVLYGQKKCVVAGTFGSIFFTFMPAAATFKIWKVYVWATNGAKIFKKMRIFFCQKSGFFFHVKLVRNNLLYSLWRFDILLLLIYLHFDCFSKNKEIILNDN